jgi:hypothetical protein
MEKRSGQPGGRGAAHSQASGQSKVSASRTFITEMLQFNNTADKVTIVNIFYSHLLKQGFILPFLNTVKFTGTLLKRRKLIKLQRPDYGKIWQL